MDSIMDIFRRTEMRFVEKDVLQRMNDDGKGQEDKSKGSQWSDNMKKRFYVTSFEPEEKELFKHKRQVVKAVIADKASTKINADPTVKGKDPEQIVATINKEMKDTLEESAYHTRSRLFNNFKNLNQGVRHSLEYKISFKEVSEDLRGKFLRRQDEFEDNLRKKFLHEKVELFYKLIRQIQSHNRAVLVLQFKIVMVRDTIHQRRMVIRMEEVNLEKLKEQGKLNHDTFRLATTTASQSPTAAMSPTRRMKIKQQRKTNENVESVLKPELS